jgi:hypothetical protein
MTATFLFKHIFTRFGCPLTIMTDQGAHLINDAIMYLNDHFILRHTNFTVYYPQGNGQVKSINKVFGTLLKKLMKIEIIRMNICPQFYFHIELPTKLGLVIPHFSWCMDYIHYYYL